MKFFLNYTYTPTFLKSYTNLPFVFKHYTDTPFYITHAPLNFFKKHYNYTPYKGGKDKKNGGECDSKTQGILQ